MSEEIAKIQERIHPRASLGKQQLKNETVKVLRNYNNKYQKGRKSRRRRR